MVFLGCKTSRPGYESTPQPVVLSNRDDEPMDHPVLTIEQTPFPYSGDNRNEAMLSLNLDRLFSSLGFGRQAE
jgi:hypothetical protein